MYSTLLQGEFLKVYRHTTLYAVVAVGNRLAAFGHGTKYLHKWKFEVNSGADGCAHLYAHLGENYHLHLGKVRQCG